MDQVTRFGEGLASGDAGQLVPANLTEANWCGLAWTPWARLEREAIRQRAPTLPGLYRIRRQGAEPARLTYIGQTGRSLRERLLALATGINGADCPHNDPHTAAPHLWLLRQLDGAQLVFSCAPVPGDVQTLRGTEDMLLWRHRIDTGRSTEANFGRFYPGYTRPTNRWIVRKCAGRSVRIPGRRAEALPAGLASASPDFERVIPPLQGDGGVLQAPWWQRACPSDKMSLVEGPGVYCIYDQCANEPAYIGQTWNLRARGATHATTLWALTEPWIAILPLATRRPIHAPHEFESDLLGWHLWQTGRTPIFQYRVMGGAA